VARRQSYAKINKGLKDLWGQSYIQSRVTTTRVAKVILKTKICYSTLKNTLAFYKAGVVAVNSKVVLTPGANPTIASYSVV
jgi:hypothetical protein